ncbi:UTP--glucose-1-phosphate uridylyltransferase [Borrelia nietonii YOR]|uniref:UTP--glucose-1-phosphate uridylyltransferase n=1 Tax=Borrelia nietonii YOR TaxID=1293576 RepID=A0ABN4C7H1_9SPIR|nr:MULTISPECIES: UTP--glucose-1-phosphate uridylyltransferase [Borrelia]AHH03172.1 UTP--glucose-1-phosphate uridylyltransferase [Borrelia nietonii YOR]AHH12221.1 UTP--glucose-1-phosphate uridylyltransferase [Borrelia hermsii YBT]AHH13704.1 UTP--glucose-1-phosphate uridylyltransferase [Borrelia hermsii MTW]UPA08931.1 UTP--glucose-1-phosphate uridylyltransferase [Borrelia nietonii YOR]
MKGIILAAGYGTRFLPITKTIPKEMLPILNKPAIDYIIEEFTSSGIKEILIITSRRKGALDNYFDREIELETEFTKKYREDLLKKIKLKDINISFIRQNEMMGTGHALLQVKPWIGTESVIVAYPDDLHVGSPPLTAQLIELHKKTGKNILSVIENPKDINRYGVIELNKDNIHVKDIVEKPEIGKEPSNKASIGRFLYTHEFFKFLEEGFKLHQKGEYHHIYALKKLMSENKVLYKEIEGERLDIGDIGGYLEAIIKIAKRNDQLLQIIKDSLRN